MKTNYLINSGKYLPKPHIFWLKQNVEHLTHLDDTKITTNHKILKKAYEIMMNDHQSVRILFYSNIWINQAYCPEYFSAKFRHLPSFSICLP